MRHPFVFFDRLFFHDFSVGSVGLYGFDAVQTASLRFVAFAHSDDLECLANIAREQLGLLLPDEIRFVDTSN